MIKREYQPKLPDGTPAGPVQVFEAETEAELIDKLASAHEHASAKIAELRTKVKPVPEQASDWQPRALTADEKFQIAEKLKDPSTVDEAIAQAVEAKYGLSNRLSTTEKKTAKQIAIEETNAFVDRHPEFHRCPENQAAMEGWLAQNNAAWTLENLEIAYDNLAAGNKLKAKPDTAIRQRGSTGLRREHSSAAPVVKQDSQKALREEIDREIKNGTYRQRIAGDQRFRAAVDALGR